MGLDVTYTKREREREREEAKFAPPVNSDVGPELKSNPNLKRDAKGNADWLFVNARAGRLH